MTVLMLRALAPLKQQPSMHQAVVGLEPRVRATAHHEMPPTSSIWTDTHHQTEELYFPSLKRMSMPLPGYARSMWPHLHGWLLQLQMVELLYHSLSLALQQPAPMATTQKMMGLCSQRSQLLLQPA